MAAPKDPETRRREAAEIRAALVEAGALASPREAAEYDRAAAGFADWGRLAVLRFRLPKGRTARVTLTALAGRPSGVVVVAGAAERAAPRGPGDEPAAGGA